MDIIFEEPQQIEQIKKPDKQNPKDSISTSLSSCNFERLFSEIVEAQSDIESLDDGVQKFFSQYMKNIINPNEIKNTVKIIKQNSAIQDKIYDYFKIFLEEDLKENKEKVEKGMKITKQIETKTYQVARAKDMFRELNDMMHGDIISHQKEIKKVEKGINDIHNELIEYDKKIEALNAENKTTYTEELNLLDTVMSFGKKLYTTYATREEKKKEKIKLEAELIKLKEEKKAKDLKYEQDMNAIIRNKENAQTEFENRKNEIELFLSSYPNNCDEYDNIIKSLKKFYSLKLEKFNLLKKTQKEKRKSNDIAISPLELKEHIDCCDNNILQELFNNIEIIRKIHPYLSIPPNIDINNIIDVVESLSNQISFLINEETPQEKINLEKERQMKEIGKKIADLYYEKFIKHLFLNSLKLNAAEGKKKKEAERKLLELKNKEEKLKQLQMKYEQESKNSQNSQITISSFNSSKDNISQKGATNNRKEYPPVTKYPNNDSSSSSSSTTFNTINIKVKDKKKEDKRKNKQSTINTILEEDDYSKSKSKDKEKDIEYSKKDRKKQTQKDKERENDFDEKKNNKQKTNKKKGKVSQNKKKKNKKSKKYLDDSSDISNDSFADNDNNNKYDHQHIFTQMLVTDCENSSKDNNKEKEKDPTPFYESDRKNKVFNYPKEEKKIKIVEHSDTFDLNDLNFLTELGEDINKSEKNVGYGRKNNYRK